MSTIITKPKVEIDKQLLTELLTLTKEEKQVIVHCLFDARNMWGAKIRIWPSTYLYDSGSAHRSELVHADNISFTPQWTEIPEGKVAHFSLIFTGLSSACSTFDLIEEIPQAGGFKVTGIKRNDSDVYYVWV